MSAIERPPAAAGTSLPTEDAGTVMRHAHLTYATDSWRECWWLSVLADEHGPAADHWFPRGPLPPSPDARRDVLTGWGLRPRVTYDGTPAEWQWSENCTNDPDRSRLYATLWVEPEPSTDDAARRDGETS
ncbi:hypothetical protein [Streptomyces sp. CA2R106]|uniref:hypothetical protein n=1 Tax=Streptomyces sp. CA2R106 TaxID=3120153 RepID=UPI00300B82F3